MLVARKSERGVSILHKLGITGRSGPAGLFVTTMDDVFLFRTERAVWWVKISKTDP